MNNGTDVRLNRIFLVLLAVGGGLLMAAAARTYYVRQSEAVESSVSGELAAIAEIKATQIANWRHERLGDGNVLLSALDLSLARRALSGASETELASFEELLRRIVMVYGYADAALVDRQGLKKVQVNPDHSDPERLRTLQSVAAASGKVMLSDFYRARSGKPWMSLVVPIPKSGAIILGIDPSMFLYPYLQSWPAANRSGEVFLARREDDDFICLSPLRHSPDAAFRLRRSIRSIAPSKIEPYKSSFSFKVSDYRGVPVMGTYHQVSDSSWYVFARLDLAEVTEPLRRLGLMLGLMISVIVALNVTGVILVWRSRQLRFHRQREDLFRRIANDTPACLWTLSAQGDMSFVNQQCRRFLGTKDDTLVLSWADYIHPEEREKVLEEFAKHLKSADEFVAEFRVRRFDGCYRWIVSDMRPRIDPNSRFSGYAGVFTDVTERREAEQKLRDANRTLGSELQERARSAQQIQALTARLIDAHEEERSRLARELHDDLSQQIAAISIGASNLKRQIPADSAEAIALTSRLQQSLSTIADCVRRLSHALHPATLQHCGLAAALRNYCDEIAALSARRIAFRVEGSCDAVPSPVALCAYRVTQEALQNSIKHAHANDAAVELVCGARDLCLVVSDRGVGMELETAKAGGGLGLLSMKERARLVNGTLEINSRPDEGTTVKLTISY